MLSPDTQLTGDESDPLSSARKKLQQFSTPSSPAQRWFLPDPEGGNQEYTDYNSYIAAGGTPTPSPIKNDTPVLKAPDAAPLSPQSTQATDTGGGKAQTPTLAAPAPAAVTPPPAPPPPPPPSGTPIAGAPGFTMQGGYVPPTLSAEQVAKNQAVTTVNGVAMPQYVANQQSTQGVYDSLTPEQKHWLTQPAGQDALDAAGGDYSQVNWGEFAHPTVAQVYTPYGAPQRTAEEAKKLPIEQQIAEHLYVPGDPNNKGFGGTPGVDPTNGAPAEYVQGGVRQYADGSAVPNGYNAQQDALSQALANAGGAPAVGGAPIGTPTLATSGTGDGITPKAAGGPATDSTPSIPSNVPLLGNGGQPVTSGSGDGVAPGASIPPEVLKALQSYTTQPGGLSNTPQIQAGTPSDLTSTAVLPGSDVDRFALAQKRLSDFRAANDPVHDARTRKIIENNGAALGRLGSGMLNTDVGNEQDAYNREQSDLSNRLLSDAIEGTIGDARSNRNELRGERGYQGDLERQAYGRSVDEYKLGQDADARAFDEAMRRAQFGDTGNPSGLDVAAGASKRQSADSDQRAYQQLVSGLTQRQASGDSQAGSILDWLKKQIAGGADESQAMDAILKALPSLQPQLTPSAGG